MRDEPDNFIRLRRLIYTKEERRKICPNEDYVVYHCHGCNKQTVLDIGPFEVKCGDAEDTETSRPFIDVIPEVSKDRERSTPISEPRSNAMTAADRDRQKKLDQLQRILNKSKSGTTISSTDPKGGLSDFLKKLSK